MCLQRGLWQNAFTARVQHCWPGPTRLPGLGLQVELFCISKLINCMLDADEEFVYMDCHFAVGPPFLSFACNRTTTCDVKRNLADAGLLACAC